MTFWDFVNNHWIISFISFIALLLVVGLTMENILNLIQNVKIMKWKKQNESK